MRQYGETGDKGFLSDQDQIVRQLSDCCVFHGQHVTTAEVKHDVGPDLGGKVIGILTGRRREVVELDFINVVLEVLDDVVVFPFVKVEHVSVSSVIQQVCARAIVKAVFAVAAV